mmetsp:Transcript_3739/g.4161  ORF Transcript_3739/g.4161 Transcript_3739/m.4161 type:complete len:266 (+) Transcript_3739:56-853(+)
MRQKRAKAYKKQMNVYLHTFKFREPFQTIVDDEIILNCQKASFDIAKGLNRTIQGETKPMITQCSIEALYKTNNQDAITIAKLFERRRCNHPPANPIPSSECIKSIVDINGENKHRYLVATQDKLLRNKLSKVPGVPLIYMNRSVMVMEPMSEATSSYSNSFEHKKLTGGLNDVKVGKINKQEVLKSEETGNVPTRKRKGPKEPNPLSIKKKKTVNTDSKANQDASSQPKPKRRRKHKSTSEKTADLEKPNSSLSNSSEPVVTQE